MLEARRPWSQRCAEASGRISTHSPGTTGTGCASLVDMNGQLRSSLLRTQGHPLEPALPHISDSGKGVIQCQRTRGSAEPQVPSTVVSDVQRSPPSRHRCAITLSVFLLSEVSQERPHHKLRRTGANRKECERVEKVKTTQACPLSMSDQAGSSHTMSQQFPESTHK